MDLDLAAQPGRTAGTDAERRAAVALARALRAGRRREAGREAFRTRPGQQLVQALAAVLGVAASVVSVDHPIAGAALAAAGLLLAALDLAGLRATPSRATQTVVSPAPRERRVTLVLTAAIDAPRRGLVRRVPAAEPLGLLALALVATFCALRIAGAEGTLIGAAQLVPTTVLVLLVGGWVDEALASPARDGSAAAVVLAVARELDALPPHALGVEVVLAGAGGVRADGLRRRLRKDPRDLAVVHVEPCATGRPFWLRPAHPQLARAAAAAGGTAKRGSLAPVRIARRRRKAAIAVTTRGSEPGGPEATAAFVVGLVRALDAELAR